MDESLFRWYGHMGHIAEDKLFKMLCGRRVNGTGRNGRLKMRWTNAVSVLFRLEVCQMRMPQECFDHVQ